MTPNIKLSGIQPSERCHLDFSDARNDTTIFGKRILSFGTNDNTRYPKIVAIPLINNASESNQTKISERQMLSNVNRDVSDVPQLCFLTAIWTDIPVLLEKLNGTELSMFLKRFISVFCIL